MRDLIKEVLIRIGEDIDREGLKKTPARVEASLRFLTKGYNEDINRILNGALYREDYDEMVVLKDIELFSMCEHHLLPFTGKCHIAYIPNGKLIGLSKIPRVVEVFSRRLQLQERLTMQIANSLNTALEPMGVAVVIEAFHLCMIMRGVEKQNTLTITSSMLGIFRKNRATREEFLSLIRKGQI